MRTTQGQRFFERRMQAFDGNVIVSLAQLDVLLDQNRRLKAEIEELEDKQIEQLENQSERKDIADYQFLLITKDKKGDRQQFSGRLSGLFEHLPADTIKFQILDERLSVVIDQERFPHDRQ